MDPESCRIDSMSLDNLHARDAGPPILEVSGPCDVEFLCRVPLEDDAIGRLGLLEGRRLGHDEQSIEPTLPVEGGNKRTRSTVGDRRGWPRVATPSFSDGKKGAEKASEIGILFLTGVGVGRVAQ